MRASFVVEHLVQESSDMTAATASSSAACDQSDIQFADARSV